MHGRSVPRARHRGAQDIPITEVIATTGVSSFFTAAELAEALVEIGDIQAPQHEKPFRNFFADVASGEINIC